MRGRLAGLVLAGGRGRRMGGADKAFLLLHGRPLIAHALARLGPQVSAVAISANGDPARFAAWGALVLADAGAAGEGPLAGILAGLSWARGIGAGALVTVAVDTPFFPRDLAARLEAAGGGTGRAAVAASGGRTHPTFALWPVAGAQRLADGYADGMRRVGEAAALLGAASCDFEAEADGFDPFFNINAPAELVAAEARLESPGGPGAALR
ncbi:MAG: molybdenum cofactor guanylyltransferase MobA [Paracoccaceae bacterium]